MMDADVLLAEWFGPDVGHDEAPSGNARWFGGGAEFDALLRDEFGGWLAPARDGELSHWRKDPRHWVALVLLLDQLPRNLFRGTPEAFAYDTRALEEARAALEAGVDQHVHPVWRGFFYLPFEHSEALADQHVSVARTKAAADTGSGSAKPILDMFADYAVRHLRVIERFGRFPHRNSILQRPSTPEELAFLEEPGSSF